MTEAAVTGGRFPAMNGGSCCAVLETELDQ